MGKIDYNKIFKVVYNNRINGISVKETLRSEFNMNNTANFYKAITKNQIRRLSNLKGLTTANKKEFKRLYLEENESATYLAKIFKIRTKTALDFAKTLTDEYVLSFKNKNRKLTSYAVKKILIRIMRGERQIDLAKEYNVSASNINNIYHGRLWKHIFQGVQKKYNIEILSITESK